MLLLYPKDVYNILGTGRRQHTYLYRGSSHVCVIRKSISAKCRQHSSEILSKSPLAPRHYSYQWVWVDWDHLFPLELTAACAWRNFVQKSGIDDVYLLIAAFRVYR